MKPASATTCLAALLVSSSFASAAVVTFESGVGNCATMSSGDVFTNQCAGDGVIGSANDYYYVDTRDTFDSRGISNTANPGQLFFTNPVTNLSMDYALIDGFSAVFEIFDASHILLGTYLDDAIGGDKNASFDWGAISGIAELDFSAVSPGAIGMSTLRFDSAPIPEPASLALAGLGLAGLGFSRRKKG